MAIGCTPYPDPPGRHSVTLPGGAVIESPPIFDPHTKLIELQSMMAVLSPALAGLVPAMATLMALVAVIDMVKAIASLDPVAIANAMADFIEAVEKIAGLVPAVSFPLMIVGILTLIIDFIIALVDYMTELLLVSNQIQMMKDYALSRDLPEMLESAACLETNLQTQISYFESGVGALAGFMAIVEILGSLIGLDLGIDLSTPPGESMEETIDRLTGIRDTLITIRDAIPI